ncbi:hypothetical protein Osc2_17010 [Ruminococcus sp. 25CYCFAH16]
MINLRDFLFCDVILIDTDDKKWKGRIFSFHDADDNSENENSITLKRPESDTNVIEFLESEIKSIEIAKPSQ